MRKILLILSVSFLLSGCWDEVLYKEITIVPLSGLDGEPGKVTAYFSFPTVTEEKVEYSTAEGRGISLRDARNNAFTHANEMLDVSQLEVFLVSGEAAKSNLYNYIEVIYRAPRTRLSGRIAIVEEEVSKHFEIAETLPGNAPDFYTGLLETAIKFSIIPDYNFQQTGKLMFDAGMDVALPSIHLSKKTGFPEVSGVALFNRKEFTGDYLDLKESKILTVLRKKGQKKFAQFTYEWEKDGVKYPVTVEYLSLKRDWNITNDKIEATYQFKFSIEEFAYAHLDKKDVLVDLERFLSQNLTRDFQEVIYKLQKAKSDAVGFGQHVRAFHQDLWNKGNWQDTFSEMDIQMKVEAKIVRSGILD